ncbi:apolipoprotein N-acyltransferase [Antrihabitans spumae]|uniref:Apolipoprotein N-acyltransferase n=1 Tax=Antrihabitans spumae TaxID=3373370 RepID=A0ABW7KRE1_9NOCA
MSVRSTSERSAVLRNLLGSVVAGLLLFASFPPRPLWFLAPVGVAVLVLVLTSGTSKRGGFGYGAIAGLGFFVPLLPWIGIYVGPLPWLALAGVCALYVGLFGVVTRIVAALPYATLWIAMAWSLSEWVRSSWPFGGFPWGRLAFGQADGILLPIANLGGAPLLSFAVALCGSALAAVVRACLARDRTAILGGVAAFALAPIVAGVVWPFLPGMASGDRHVTVAAIQGSVPRLGLEFNAQRRKVLDNHVAETMRLADDVRTGRAPKPDVVIWPENSSDIDPYRNSDASGEITAAAAAVGAPILVGAVLTNDDRTTTNSVIAWTAESGPGSRHDKRIIQPFGEYLPWRGFFRLFSSYADSAGYFVPGHGDGTVTAAGLRIGVATCYEVAFDRALKDSVRAGAQLLAVPTNNATFGDSEMTYQQLAMSRVRAVEHGRAVVVAATSGVSAIIAPDGSVSRESDLFVPATLLEQVPLRTGTTLATRLGPIPEIVLGLGAIVAMIVGFRRTRGAQGTTGKFSQAAAGEIVTPAAAGRTDTPAIPAGRNSMAAGNLGQVSAKTLVIIPTYDERENLPIIIGRLHAALPATHVLVVDDGSPDGTGAVADELAAASEGKINVMHRTEKNGLGAAYIAGFRWGLERDYQVLVEMDADGSHAPEQLHRLLHQVDAGADLVIGSRYVPGGTVVNWPKRREFLSRGGNVYSRLALGVKIKDITGGYRAYRREILEALDLDTVESHGYCFQVDLAWRLIQKGAVVVEVPITFTEREIGESKMSGNIVREALLKVTAWGFKNRIQKLKALTTRKKSSAAA